MGFWDVLLFNVAAVLGPRWIAAAAHNGPSSIALWIIAAVGFFLPTALVVIELSSRFPEEGGLYAWARDAFGDFHGFVAGWTYWIYSVFYFPALLVASAAMSAYVIGPRRRGAGAESHISSDGLVHSARRRSRSQHRGAEYRQMAAERGRRGHLSAHGDSGGGSFPRLAAPRLRRLISPGPR